MGTDIHLLVEQRINGQWFPISVRSKCHGCEGASPDDVRIVFGFDS